VKQIAKQGNKARKWGSHEVRKRGSKKRRETAKWGSEQGSKEVGKGGD